MNKKDVNDVFSSEEQSLLDCLSSSYLSIEDVRWLKSKRWFKRFLKIYSKELKKRYKNKPIIKKEIKTVKEDVEVLDFTQSIKMPSKEVIEILDFTKTLDITDINGIVKANEKAKKKVMFEKIVWEVIITISSFVLVILIVILVNWYLENKNTNKMIDQIYEVAELNEVTTTTINKETTTKNKVLSDYEKYANMNIIDVNFDNLKAINPDTVGWIYVPGTKINYPFVHTTDNEYYLKHTFNKTSNSKGWVYLDYRNNIDNLSKNNILYAHGLVNNQMFGSMRNVVKKSWYTNKSNNYIKISTPNNNYVWQVFSTYTIEPESYYITTYFNDNSEFEKFIDTIKTRSVYDYGVDVNKNDKILTLSSCYDNKKRMVLHAKLISL